MLDDFPLYICLGEESILLEFFILKLKTIEYRTSSSKKSNFFAKLGSDFQLFEMLDKVFVP